MKCLIPYVEFVITAFLCSLIFLIGCWFNEATGMNPLKHLYEETTQAYRPTEESQQDYSKNNRDMIAVVVEQLEIHQTRDEVTKEIMDVMFMIIGKMSAKQDLFMEKLKISPKEMSDTLDKADFGELPPEVDAPTLEAPMVGPFAIDLY